MMSWVMSTCMAWTGVHLASLNAMSPSGAPTRAMPPVGSSCAAMLEWVAARLGNEVERGVKLAPGCC